MEGEPTFDLFQYLEEHSGGIGLAVGLLFVLLIAVTWLAFIFKWGRYKKGKEDSAGFGYVVAQFFSNIIDDFRHLLALLIFLIFVGVTIFMLVGVGGDTKSKVDALQAVMSAFAGLLGSIIGYYFGEKAATRTNQNQVNLNAKESEEEPEDFEITKTEKKPNLK